MRERASGRGIVLYGVSSNIVDPIDETEHGGTHRSDTNVCQCFTFDVETTCVVELQIAFGLP
jgi:hypothetical protein